jgi:glycosyltransferase involved in cell wall biosynthesis
VIRVLRVITRLNIGGPAIQAIALSDRLTARGFETMLVHGRLGAAEGDMQDLVPASVRALAVPALRRPVAPAADAAALAQIVRVVREFEPHVVHTHMAKAGAVGRLAAAIHHRTNGRRRRLAVVHTYHGHVLEGYFSPVATRMAVGVERRLARLTDRLVAISPTIRRELLEEQRIGTPGQYRVVPLGFDLRALASIGDRERAAARAALNVPAGAHVVTTVGRLTAIKEHRLFLEAAAAIAARDRDALFLIAGDGELRSALEQLARALGIGDRVRFLGWRRDLATIYGASDLFLLTSRNEGTPVALIESLAAGVPAVSTDVGGVRDVIGGDELGLLAPFGDVAAIADRVGSLLPDPDRRRVMGAAGRRASLARYSIDRLLDDIEALYREALA